MCRLLAVKSNEPFAIAPYLRAFATTSKNSTEYQGHGWGMAYREASQWIMHHQIEPIWESNLDNDSQTTLLIAHARSAFRDEGITVENNMPFQNDNTIFAFNGELHGVRIKSLGRIGAEKIFNYILRFRDQGLPTALDRATDIITKRSRYIRAMNIIMADGQQLLVKSQFNEDPDYFTMHHATDHGATVICSDPLPHINNWSPIQPNKVHDFS